MALDQSYQQLTADQQRMYRLLGLHPGSSFDTYAAAALADSTQLQSVEQLDQLFDVHLLQELTPGRFAFHDLVRAHSVGTAIRDEAEPRMALSRLLDHYKYTAAAAMDATHPYERKRGPRVPSAGTPSPNLPDPQSAIGWLDAELPNLLAAAQHAAKHGWPSHTWHLSIILHPHLRTRGRYSDAEALHRHALTTARIAGHRVSELDALVSSGQVQGLQGRFEQAIDHYRQALEIARATGREAGMVDALTGLGWVHRLQDSHDQATDFYRQALQVAHTTGHNADTVGALTGLGWIDLFQGRHDQAFSHYRQALEIAHTTGDRASELNAQTGLGWVRGLQDAHEQATGHFQQALEIAHATGDRAGELDALTGLGWVDLLRNLHDQVSVTV